MRAAIPFACPGDGTGQRLCDATGVSLPVANVDSVTRFELNLR